MSTSKTHVHINTAIDNILFQSNDGTLHGKVCLVCDKFMLQDEQSEMSLKIFLKVAHYLTGTQSTPLPVELRKCYTFTVPGIAETNQVLRHCLLSPRSQLYHKRRPFIMICKECKAGLNERRLQQGILPRFAIANNMAIGNTPMCLLELNDIEVALISQARFRGHLFTYWGGCHKSIKGWHCFYEVNPNNTTAVLGAVAHFTQTENIAVVLSGPFTTNQKQHILQKTQVNADKVLKAFAWLKPIIVFMQISLPLHSLDSLL
jgi:hypothetical protein